MLQNFRNIEWTTELERNEQREIISILRSALKHELGLAALATRAYENLSSKGFRELRTQATACGLSAFAYACGQMLASQRKSAARPEPAAEEPMTAAEEAAVAAFIAVCGDSARALSVLRMFRKEEKSAAA